MKNYWIEQNNKEMLADLVTSMLTDQLSRGALDMQEIMEFINEYVDKNQMNKYTVNVKVDDGEISVHIY